MSKLFQIMVNFIQLFIFLILFRSFKYYFNI